MSENFTFEKAIDILSEKIVLAGAKKPVVGGFWDFLRDIWSKSYENPALFNTFHIGVIAEDIEKAIQDKKNYCCVLPRYHLKSTVLGYAFSVYAFLKYGHENFDSSGMYLSYSDGMSTYHISEMKKAIRRNEQLKEWMKDRVPQADFSFRYYIGGVQADILHGGLFSFKRGSHVNRFLVADDLLRDPDNPLNLTQLAKAEEHFMTESMYIPVGDATVIVLGTPMAPNDLFTKLKEDERFLYRFLPALDPVPGRRVLCPEIRDEKALMAEKKARPRSFASEMMLVPYLSTVAYINDEELSKRENKELKSLDPYKIHNLDSDFTVAGFDIGKKRHPSHLVVYTSKNGRLTQIHQSFLDGWDFTRQKDFLNEVVENFNINMGYVDNTRNEMEDRGLDKIWKMMSFTEKSKRAMAQALEEYITNDKIELILDERQHSQIVCVDNELKAPETTSGHGDSFFSNALAVLAHKESTVKQRGVQTVANLADMSDDIIPNKPVFDRENNAEKCPQCGEWEGWIAENKLCLLCEKKFK